MRPLNCLCPACGLSFLLLAGCGKSSSTANPGSSNASSTSGNAAKAGALSYAVREYAWKVGDPGVPLLRTDAGVCFLSSLSGNFAGYGEEVSLLPASDGTWHLQGKGQQEGIAAKATGVSSLSPAVFRPGAKQYEWASGQPPVQMLAKGEGVCFLAGVSGSFAGYGEEVRVRLGDDGYWYLEGRSGQAELKARAVGLQWGHAGAAAVEIQAHTWSAGKPAVRLLRKEEGLCFLGSVAGSLSGGGEEVRVHLSDDGFWYLGGQTGQEALSARAITVRLPKP